MSSRGRWIGLGAGAAIVVAVLALLAGSAFASPPAPNGQGDHGHYAQVFISKLAGILGVDEKKLNDSIKQAANQTVDQAVQDGKLTQDQASRLKDRIQKAGPEALGFGPLGAPNARGPHPGVAMLGRDVQNAIAQKLGLTADQLHQQLRSGKTLDQIAKEKGVTKQELGQAAADAAKPKLDEAVKNGRITQQQEDTILQQLKSGDFPGLKGPYHGKGHPGVAMLGRDIQNAIAQKLGLTADQLHQELRSGKTLDQIAQEKGVTKQELGTAAADAAKPKLDEAVKNGRITQQQEDQMLDQLRSGNFPELKGHQPGRGHPKGPTPAPGTSSS